MEEVQDCLFKDFCFTTNILDACKIPHDSWHMLRWALGHPMGQQEDNKGSLSLQGLRPKLDTLTKAKQEPLNQRRLILWLTRGTAEKHLHNHHPWSQTRLWELIEQSWDMSLLIQGFNPQWQP